MADDRRVRWRANHPHKYAAQQAVKGALVRGVLTREPCLFCGHEKTQAHHHDYGRPLDVTWLCCLHHHLAHGRMTREQVKRAIAKRSLGELRSLRARLQWRDDRGRFAAY